jgi:methyltransferase
MAFILFILVVIFLRIAELLLSKRNEIWLLQNGAVEYGHKHYPFIVALHVSFFIALAIDYYTQQSVSFSPFFLTLYVVLIAFKVWIVLSLGKFWNTKIYHIPGLPLQKKGLYKYIQHPNYLVVVAEIVLIPLVFHLYFTAIIFSLLNAIMLYVRITAENKVLKMDQNQLIKEAF